MRFSALAKPIELLTPERSRIYGALTLAFGLSLSLSLFVAEPERLRNNVDFPAFYNAGRIINDYPTGSLYKREVQQNLYREIAPRAASRSNLFFVYTPFFALVFAPLALLPYLLAFACWALISLALFTAGFRLTWSAASLPLRHRTTGFVLAFGFLPFYFLCLLVGQTSVFGFFWLALAIYFDRKGRSFLSGSALALLLYKPPLLILLVPMLMVTKRWRTLAGFCVGAGVLGLLSLAVLGPSGLVPYLNLLTAFSQDPAAGKHPIWLGVDALSFLQPLVGERVLLARGLVLALIVIVIPFLLAAWRQRREAAWALAITWTLVLNLYVPIYDSTLVILAAPLSIEMLRSSQSNLPNGFRWLLLALFLVPWVARQTAQSYGFQPLTVVLAAFGCYQLWATLRADSNPTAR